MQRMSYLFSAMAVFFLALACSLGYQSEPARHTPGVVQASIGGKGGATTESYAHCRQLDRQVESCAQALVELRFPRDADRYRGTVKELVARKRRAHVRQDTGLVCRGQAGDPAREKALRACLSRNECTDFARCVADNLDD